MGEGIGVGADRVDCTVGVTLACWLPGVVGVKAFVDWGRLGNALTMAPQIPQSNNTPMSVPQPIPH